MQSDIHESTIFSEGDPKHQILGDFNALIEKENLGPDFSSDFFIKREKSIAYLINFQEKWIRLDYEFVGQSEAYNDFSGGLRVDGMNLRSWVEIAVPQKLD